MVAAGGGALASNINTGVNSALTKIKEQDWDKESSTLEGKLCRTRQGKGFRSV